MLIDKETNKCKCCQGMELSTVAGLISVIYLISAVTHGIMRLWLACGLNVLVAICLSLVYFKPQSN